MSRTQVTTGFVIVRPDGRRVDDTLYDGEVDAAIVCAFLNGCRVAPAKRITTFQRKGGQMVPVRTEISIQHD
ncbi:hypothetical protein [Aquamicrobium zhengzhouense]|uniref:Uncharacterized protein n=1 Tax=Aquamicrobium zhengzhouense TaxID=2781738 RepID=A0ABS0SAM9_9HYPH|nr:hypothetical protein [Aquamicrobium zhengzhouense]MBI1620343.1 hypothetical protein [Aquamicrobium zhengzhouense]